MAALISLSLALGLLHSCQAVELTFELPDSAKECFHEIIQEGTQSTVEFQVVTGGHYDVDVMIMDPQKM